MVAMNIFHEPSFAEKLLNVTSLWQLTALLAAIAGYASHFLNHREGDPSTKTPYQSEYFVDLAFHYVNKALVDCDDEMPPLCLLQALIVATHCQLAQGVRGKAWRSLGLCIRLAYETNLHVLDSRTAVNTTDPDKWQADEEKRRVFWAIWEMDVFASTIRRTPTAIDWRQMEILLPVDNAHWFQGQPTPSCFMDPDPNQCWKGLQDSGNQSPKAWFLVINSFMKKAQSISDSQWPSAASNLGHYQPNHRTPDSIEEGRQKLEILANAVRCLSLALPSHMRYYDQYLAFGPPVQGQLESQRQQHCSIYNIFIMIQLARLMIYRYDAFKPQSRRSDPNGCPHPEDLSVGATLGRHDSENVAQREYFDAADRILRIVTQSCEEHIKYINPFLASTLWLASAVQLVRKHFARAASNRSLIKSRFDVLYLTYRRCVDFWGTKTALQRNLESLEEQLEARKKQLETRDAQNFQKSSKRALKDAGMISQPFPGLQADHIARHAKRKRTSLHASHPTNRDDHALRLTPRKPKNNPPTEYIPETPTIPIATSTLPYGGLDMRAQSYAKQQSAVADSMPILGTMPLPPPDRNHTSETYMMPMSLNPFDTPDLGDTQQDLIVDWCNPDLSGDLQDLLARWTTY
ncbi:hypothetical protein N7457_002355 [Penicillium paradoxum]|uniref:uncharacterized protein n=1 Tax=Penicillium paradoxum TaxID=176176 RepID=UPI002548D78B|nr:uncharacterized protein N7457_002355 [Penicillium paradoxum]KAJ5787365.1 hypothetical protein N7457_002355 [Penicillium paradoxum]